MFFLSKVKYYCSKAIKKIRLASIIKSNIHITSKVEAGSTIINCDFGAYSFCGYDCDLNFVEIGKFVSIANSVIIGGNSHPMDWVSMSPVFYEGRDSVRKKFSEFSRKPPEITKVSHDVWIGHGAHIKQGVNIGIGAVIGMGSVVTKDIKPYEVVAGNPAKFIRHRFDEETVKSLLNSCWWELSDEQLFECAQYIQEPDKFLEEVDKIKGQ